MFKNKKKVGDIMSKYFCIFAFLHFFTFLDQMKILLVCIFLLVGIVVSDIDVEVSGKTRYQYEP